MENILNWVELQAILEDYIRKGRSTLESPKQTAEIILKEIV